MAVPASVSEIVWSLAKVVPPVLTVTVELPAASAMLSALTATDSVGAASSSVMVTVCCAPMVTLLRLAVISTVSSTSSMVSCTAVTVAITEA